MEPLDSNQEQKNCVPPFRISVRWLRLPFFPRKENVIVTPIIPWWCPRILSGHHRKSLRSFGHSYRYNRKTFKFDFASNPALPISSKIAHWKPIHFHPFAFICSGQNPFDFCQIRPAYSSPLLRQRNQNIIAPIRNHRIQAVKAFFHARNKLSDYIPISTVAFTRRNLPEE